MRLIFNRKPMPDKPGEESPLGPGFSFLAFFVIGLYAAFLLLWAYLWKGRLPFHIDTRLYAYCDHWINREIFHRGFIPLWNPYIGCGTPHLANWQSACFYPPFWLFNFTQLGDWFMWMAVAHQALAFTGCYFWLRAQKVDPLWSALGALSFAGSANLVSCSANLPFLTTAAWIPWIFWAVQRALEKPALSRWALASLFLGFQVLAGYPFFTFYTVIFLVLWFEFQRPSISKRLFFIAALGFAALLTCLQWLPFLDFLTYSGHDAWKEYPYLTKPVELLTLLKPDVLGLLGSSTYKGSFANANFNLYFGLVPLVALAVGLFNRTFKKFWGLSALAWLLWLCGPQFFIFNTSIPRWLEWVEPSKAVDLFILCAVTSAALALNSFFSPGRAKVNFRLLSSILALVWMADIFLVPFFLLQPMPDPYRNPSIQRDAAGIKELVVDGRMVSVHTPSEFAFSGEAVFTRAFETPVRMFLPNSNAIWGIRSVDQYLFQRVDGSENLIRYMNKGFPYSGDLFDIAGVRLFLMPQTLPNPKYQTIGKLENDFLILNHSYSPGMRWVKNREEFTDRPSLLNLLAEGESGWREKVYFDKKPGGNLTYLAAARRAMKEAAPEGYQRPVSSRASWLSDFKGKGYVVFNETYAPGWHAWVDGKPTGIARAYGLFMATGVEKGRHQVDFRYEPVSFRLGLFLSLLVVSFGTGIFFKKIV